MKKRNILAIILSVLILLPFLFNILGWNLYAYIKLGEKDLILGAVNGLSHNGIAKSDEYFRFENEPFPAYHLWDPFSPDRKQDLIQSDSFQLCYVDRDGSMTPAAFRSLKSQPVFTYPGFEFPWLALGIIPALILLTTLRRKEPCDID